MLPQCSFTALLILIAHHPASGFIAARSSSRSVHGAVHKRRDNQTGALFSGLQERDNDHDRSITETQPSQQQQPDKSSNSNSNNAQSLSQTLSLLGTSPRRIFLSLASSAAIALSANFFGITSNLLSALPEEFAEETGLDSVYPRGDYKRASVRGTEAVSSLGVASNGSNGGKCTFLIPKEWVADTGLALAQAQRRAKALDYAMASPPSSERRRPASVLPDAAYGPPGSGGDTNVSVIINTDVRNFRLSSLGNGDPTSAAELLLSNRPRPAALASAREETRGGDAVYRFEYTVDRGEGVRPLRAVSIVAGSRDGDAFVTLTVVSTEEMWETPLVGEGLRRVVESFKLV